MVRVAQREEITDSHCCIDWLHTSAFQDYSTVFRGKFGKIELNYRSVVITKYVGHRTPDWNQRTLGLFITVHQRNSLAMDLCWLNWG